ncbi:hypothetical protein DKX38_027629 [Salix brachista]|uniref:Disease resistance N-terminal domain-containing protein n=1 Tax=Salix brachista TaxID=2182728 RepID=A0A5N5J8V0_9ROSI|nr:hypothetical protein DKX38_027629 [Salix brachista]
MADALVSVVLEQLSSIIAQEVQHEVRLVTGVKNEVRKLESNFKAIQAVLADAEQRQLKEESIKRWMGQLKDLLMIALVAAAVMRVHQKASLPESSAARWEIWIRFAIAVTLNKMSFGTATRRIIQFVCSELNVPLPDEFSVLSETVPDEVLRPMIN